MNRPHLYILTGGPGGGKTTVLEELGRRGMRIVPEVARQIIQEQVQADGTALPWANRELYAGLMLERSIQSFAEQHPDEIAFCDRGIPDTLCYLRLISSDDKKAAAACSTYRYAPMVFFTPPWEAIYTQDTERKQDFEEAVRTAERMAEVYRECGYQVVELPLVPPPERADFILQCVSSQAGRLPCSQD
jgi:predicted ATPase